MFPLEMGERQIFGLLLMLSFTFALTYAIFCDISGLMSCLSVIFSCMRVSPPKRRKMVNLCLGLIISNSFIKHALDMRSSTCGQLFPHAHQNLTRICFLYEVFQRYGGSLKHGSEQTLGRAGRRTRDLRLTRQLFIAVCRSSLSH